MNSDLGDVRRAASSVDSELELMLAVSEHVITEPDFEQLLPRICAFSAELIDAELMLVPMLDSTRSSYEYVAATGPEAELVLGTSLPIESGLCGWVLQHQRAILHGEGHDLPLGERRVWEPGMQSSLLVPLLSRGEIIGGLSGVGKRGGGSFTTRDLTLLTLFANHTSVALSNAKAIALERESRAALVAAKRRAEQHARELSAALEQQARLEEQLLHAQRMESLGRFAGGIAHDFNNLLTTIIGGLDLAQMVLDEDHRAHAILTDVITAAERGAQLTQQLLTVARRQVVKPQPTSLERAIEEADGLLRRLLPCNVELVCRPTPGVPPILADPAQLNQIVMNLVLNARDALPDGGTIVVASTHRELADGELTGHDGPIPAADYAVLSVEDDGAGIAPELMPRVFEPFYTTKGAGQGTGLGLATCYGIVKQLGGAVRVESTLGLGTRFEFFLPPWPDPGSAYEHDDESPSLDDPLAPKTIWVVEDDDMVRGFVSATLRELGHRVHSCADGDEALAQLLALPVDALDLLIADILMPGLGGWDLVEQLGDRHPNMRVLFMSGFPAEHYSDLMTQVPSDQFLHKPFRTSELAARLRRLFLPPSP